MSVCTAWTVYKICILSVELTHAKSHKCLLQSIHCFVWHSSLSEFFISFLLWNSSFCMHAFMMTIEQQRCGAYRLYYSAPRWVRLGGSHNYLSKTMIQQINNDIFRQQFSWQSSSTTHRHMLSYAIILWCAVMGKG